MYLHLRHTDTRVKIVLDLVICFEDFDFRTSKLRTFEFFRSFEKCFGKVVPKMLN